MRCPVCGDDYVCASHLYGFAEVVLALLTFGFVWPIRCHQCGMRFWRPWIRLLL